LTHAVNARLMMAKPDEAKTEGYMWPQDVPGMPPRSPHRVPHTAAGRPRYSYTYGKHTTAEGSLLYRPHRITLGR